MRLRRLVRGTLSPIKTAKSGRVFYCLQYGRKGRHVTKYMPAAELEAYRAACGGFALNVQV